ncbi:prolipoprotein diacylglyceryl transferase [Alphaproteobacteria bacterium]|nr:prolipoprotein diacylglyceryl transferase [Alphaproteobacteria bacterium]
MFVLSVSPIAFSLFGLHVYWYGILYSVAIFASWFVATFVLKKLRINGVLVPTKEEFDRFMLFSIVYVLIGARLGHVLFFDFEYYCCNPFEILMIRNGGLSFHGAVLALSVYVYSFQKRCNFSWKIMTDILSFSAALGLGIGRIANFINQELYGKVTGSENAVIFSFIDSLPRYPTQLFESFFEGFLNFWLLFIVFRIKGAMIIGTGKLTALFCIIYSSARFAIEFLKEVETHTYFDKFSLTTGQILSIALLLFGLLVLQLKDEKIVNNRLYK